MPLGEQIPLERGHQRRLPPPLSNGYFTTNSSSSVRTVADRYRLAAYHNRHCWRPFRWNTNIYDLERTWAPRIGGFSYFFSQFEAATRISRVNCTEITGDRPRQPACEIKPMLSRVSWALAHISCCHLVRHTKKTMTVQCRHMLQPSAWPLTFCAENWHTVYSSPGERSHQFWSFCAF